MVRIFGNIITPGKPTVRTSIKKLHEAVRLKDEKDHIKSVKRVVVVDGCNYLEKIGNEMSDIRPKYDTPNARAALHLIYWLYSMGFKVHFILKKYYAEKKKISNILNWHMLEHLSRRDVEIVEVLPDDQDDDFVILDRARQLKGFVISNDHYRQSEYNQFEDVPVIQVSFDPHSNMKIDPKQYLLFNGRYLTNIDIQLDISVEQFFDVAYCKPNDPDFPVVSNVRAQLPLNYHEENLRQCNVLEEFYRMRMCESYYEDGLIVESPEYFDFMGKGGAVPLTFEEFYSDFRAYVPGRRFGQNNGQ